MKQENIPSSMSVSAETHAFSLRVMKSCYFQLLYEGAIFYSGQHHNELPAGTFSPFS